MRNLKLLLSIIFAVTITCHGQIVKLDSRLYKDRVKLISQFAHRFNGTETHRLVQSDGQDSMRENLYQLLDIEYAQKPTNRDLAIELVDSIMDNDVKFVYEDPRWYARVTCAATFKGREVELIISLIKEQKFNDDHAMTWSIANVESSIFEQNKSNGNEKAMLMPNEHDMRFMHLHDVTAGNGHGIQNYLLKNKGRDALSQFNILVYYDLLNIDYVKDIEFVCYQVPGFLFTIVDRDRESSNAGWLIGHWEKLDNLSKTKQLNSLYQGNYDERWTQYQSFLAQADGLILTDDEACELVSRFHETLQSYIVSHEPEVLKELNQLTQGRYSFRSPQFVTKSEGGCSLSGKVTLDTFLRSVSHVDYITLNDIRVISDLEIKDEYKANFIPVAARIGIKQDDCELQDDVVFLIYNNQIAGILMLADSF